MNKDIAFYCMNRMILLVCSLFGNMHITKVGLK